MKIKKGVVVFFSPTSTFKP